MLVTHGACIRALLQHTTGDRIDLTQEQLSDLLGVQRTTINAVIRQLSDDGLIASRRGTVQVTERVGLMHRACECYRRLEDHFGAVIGGSGSGSGSGSG